MAVRIGLMGFGRIGRNIFRILASQRDVEVAAISDVAEPQALEYLLRFDTVFGRYPGAVEAREGRLIVDGRSIPLLAGRDPGDVRWSDHGVEVVIEATSRPRSRAEMQRHLDAGAARVILCVPMSDEPDLTVVVGVNDGDLRPSHRIVSNASCTAHCLAPVASVLHARFGIRRGFATAIHAYTNAQRLADVPAGDLRRSRAAAENIIPADTRAHELVMRLIPGLAGRLGGLAVNVPVPDGSVVDFVAQLERPADAAAVNASIREAAASSLQGVVAYETEPIVSSDVIGDPHSAIFDSLATMALGGDLVKVLAWFDNGWGYASRVVDLVKKLAALGAAEPAR